jgi:hypothetical protein
MHGLTRSPCCQIWTWGAFAPPNSQAHRIPHGVLPVNILLATEEQLSGLAGTSSSLPGSLSGIPPFLSCYHFSGPTVGPMDQHAKLVGQTDDALTASMDVKDMMRCRSQVSDPDPTCDSPGRTNGSQSCASCPINPWLS